MTSTVAGDTAGKNLAALSNKLFQAVGVFVVDVLHLVSAKAAGFSSSGRSI